MEKLIKTEVIESYIKEKGISKTKFCKICKISFSTFKKILNNDRNFGIVALFKIARVMKINICDIFIE